ncbi:hypothetical protein SAMN04487819_101167 [Actinopolyspora alba]|uniref:Uncharacterized protein n=1 Tax=Actinopolyspora alba TaxID=673379 RepID=A0A1I1TKV7_9ACTN|nr:hypothetical protein [Actinopolyspora alba]SFD59157.1 hypothetical protein SAMN04487819_101167 [Actinopolyspora alba]
MTAVLAWSFVALLNFVALLFTLSQVPDRNYWVLLINLLCVLLGGPMAMLYGVFLYRARQRGEADGGARADTQRVS